MSILSAQVRQQQAKARLQTSRRWATGLLIGATLLFVVSAKYAALYPVLAYVKAFAEAAMVGALADWFAVTALFRHPLGLPIPHTAILPRNQERIANELGRFIEHNFLQGKPIALRIYRAAPSEKLLNGLASPDMRARWLPWMVAKLPILLNLAKPEQVARFGSMMLAEQYSGAKIGKTLADGLTVMKAQGLQDALLIALLKQSRHWLNHPETRLLLEQNLREWAVKIEDQAPSTWQKLKASFKGTLVEQVDGWVAEKALDWADHYLQAALNDSQHTIWHIYHQQFEQIITALRDSPQWHQRLEHSKQQLAQSAAMQHNLLRAWQSVQDWVASDVQKNDSLCLAQAHKLLDHMLTQAAAYPQFMRRVDVWLSLMVRDLVLRYKDRAAVFVADKVKAWDSREMVEKLELSVGRDLQFIRINGTLVGGMVGLLIYCVSQWCLL